MAGLTYAAAIKAMCLAGNILVQVSPYSQVKLWEQSRGTGEADAAPYLSIAFGGWQWCYYGLFAWRVTGHSGFLILVQSNCLGALLGTYYIATFYRRCWNDQSRHSLFRYLSALGAVSVFEAFALLVLPTERALFLTGFVSSFCSFIGAFSMVTVVPQVLKAKDSSIIPGALVLANFVSAVVWCICGVMLADPMITSPNIACACTSAVCLYLKFEFPSNLDQLPSKLDDTSALHFHVAKAKAKKQMDLEEGVPLKGFSERLPRYDDTGGT
jgi:uncharacterized protein with PQ loop repeat